MCAPPTPAFARALLALTLPLACRLGQGAAAPGLRAVLHKEPHPRCASAAAGQPHAAGHVLPNRAQQGSSTARPSPSLNLAALPAPPPAPAEKYEWITKRKIGPALGFVDELEQRKIPYWVSCCLCYCCFVLCCRGHLRLCNAACVAAATTNRHAAHAACPSCTPSPPAPASVRAHGRPDGRPRGHRGAHPVLQQQAQHAGH